MGGSGVVLLCPRAGDASSQRRLLSVGRYRAQSPSQPLCLDADTISPEKVIVKAAGAEKERRKGKKKYSLSEVRGAPPGRIEIEGRKNIWYNVKKMESVSGPVSTAAQRAESKSTELGIPGTDGRRQYKNKVRTV